MLSLFPYRTKPAFLSIELILPNMIERKVTCTVMSYEIPGFPMVLSSLGAEFSGKISKDFPGVSTVISHNCQGTISKEPKLKLFFENATKNMFGTSLKIRPNTSLSPLTTFPILVTVDNFIILEPKYKYIASPIGWIPVSHEMNSDIVNCIKNGNVGTTLRLLGIIDERLERKIKNVQRTNPANVWKTPELMETLVRRSLGESQER